MLMYIIIPQSIHYMNLFCFHREQRVLIANVQIRKLPVSQLGC